MQVSLIGTGLMGRAMAERLLDLGHEVVVYNRTKEKMEPLRARGAIVARTAAEAIHASLCSILMLADYQAIEHVLFGEGHPTFQNRTIIQMGTIAPSESKALGSAIRTRLGDYFEAPVQGSIAEAKAGALLVMVGGKPEHLDRWHSLLTCFCDRPFFIGPIGQAATLKLALNQLIASHIVGFSLSLRRIQESGGDVETFMQVLRQSALMTPMFEKKLPRLLNHDYTHPNFPTSHLLKDVNLCLGTAEELGLDTTALKGLQAVIEKAMKQGLGEVDYSAVFETVGGETLTKGTLETQ